MVYAIRDLHQDGVVDSKVYVVRAFCTLRAQN
jgi:hypothetical protein